MEESTSKLCGDLYSVNISRTELALAPTPAVIESPKAATTWKQAKIKKIPKTPSLELPWYPLALVCEQSWGWSLKELYLCKGTAGKAQVGTDSALRPVDEILFPFCSCTLYLYLQFFLYFVFEVAFGFMSLIALRIAFNSFLMSGDARWCWQTRDKWR